MNAATTYKKISETTDRADHLWRYTPWKKVHPTGDTEKIPEMYEEAKIRLINLDGSEPAEGISLQRG